MSTDKPNRNPNPNPVPSHKMWQWLLDAGICHPGESVQRVVIDMDVGTFVKVYVQREGDERILAVDPPQIGWQEIAPEDP